MQKLEFPLIIGFLICLVLLYFEVNAADFVFNAICCSLAVGYFNWFYSPEIKFFEGLLNAHNKPANKTFIEKIGIHLFRKSMAIGFLSILFNKMNWAGDRLMMTAAILLLSTFLFLSLIFFFLKRNFSSSANFLKALFLFILIQVIRLIY